MAFLNLPIANLLIDLGGLIVLLFVLFGIYHKLRGGALNHFFSWQIFQNPKEAKSSSSENHAASSFLTVLVREVFGARVLGTCNKGKRLSHLAIFWGFVFLAISTTLAFLTNPNNLVLPLYNPVKLFGNVGGALVIAGFIGMFYVRYQEEASPWRITRSDLFLIVLFLAVVTGFVTQQSIYSSLGPIWVSSSFWIHMVFVIALLATAPFTKFFHAISKPISLLYEEIDSKSGVEPLLPAKISSELETNSKKRNFLEKQVE